MFKRAFLTAISLAGSMALTPAMGQHSPESVNGHGADAQAVSTPAHRMPAQVPPQPDRDRASRLRAKDENGSMPRHRSMSPEANPSLPGSISDPAVIKPAGQRSRASGAPAEWSDITMSDKLYNMAMIDRLEYGDDQGPNTYLWDAQGWYGGDFNKFWWKTEGEGPVHGGKPEATEFQALYARAISPFWYAQAGLRHDSNPNPDRSFAVLGFQGLAPYWFETDVSLFFSEQGDAILRGEFEYELLLTQRLMLQPRLEFNAAASEAKRWGQGDGLNDTEMGLRLRYEIRREFAPYIGVRWEQLYGDTKNMAQAEGEDTSSTSFVIGIRAWY